MVTTEEIKAAVLSALNAVCTKAENGLFSFGGDMEVSEDLPTDALHKILASKAPMETFEESVSDAFNDAYEYEQGVMLEQVFEHDAVKAIMNRAGEDEAYDKMHDIIVDEIFCITYFQYPYEQYLDRMVCVDIMLDAGDANYDFVLNTPIAAYCSGDDEGVDEESAILWLARQQGYTKERLEESLRGQMEGITETDSKFLQSVFEEIRNTTTHMNAVTFFVRIPLRDVMRLSEDMKGKRDGHILLSKDASCGLYGPWDGAGSILNIMLEKDVQIPFQVIHSAQPDGFVRYSAAEIWGIGEEFWTEDAVKEIVTAQAPEEKKNA